MATYYNEFDPYAAAWLRNLIAAGHLPAGDVDERSIADVRADDLRSYTACHFFAGIGGWALAGRLAGWPDDRPWWTGSCPCQPFSVAGKGKGAEDARDLWPVWFRIIRECRPATIFGEQVGAAIAHGWLDRSFADLEGQGYACGAAVLPACSVGAPHKRDRLWFVADADFSGAGEGRLQRSGELDGIGGDPCVGDVANSASRGRQRKRESKTGDGPRQLPPGGYSGGSSLMVHPASLGRGEGRPESGIRSGRPAVACASGADSDVGNADAPRSSQRDGEPGDARQERATAERASGRGAWDDAEWITGADGKARRVKSGIRLLANGVSGRVGRLRGYGNAIVPQVAAEIIGAYLDIA